MNTFISSVRFNFLYIDYYAFGRTWYYPESRLPYHLLRYIHKGSAVFFVDGKEIVVKEGQLIYLPQNTELSCHAIEEDFQFYSIRFTSSVHYDAGDLLTDYYKVPTVIGDGDACAREYFEKMLYYVKSNESSRMFWVRGYLDLLIGYIIDNGRKMARIPEGEQLSEDFTLEKVKMRIQKTNTKVDSRIQAVVDYMILHPTEGYTIKKMSDMAELSESRFRALFKSQIGKSPLEYLNEIRVMTAARKLLVSGDNISSIAYSLGFEDVNYFIRVFKKYFCMTPKQYRENAKE